MSSLRKEEVNWIGFLGICLLALPAFLDFTIVNTALPAIQQHFSVSVLSLQWVINIYGIIQAGVMIAVGRFADLYGRRGILYVGAGFFAVGALGSGFSPSIDWLIVFRLFAGLGASFLFILPITVIPQVVGDKSRQRFIGYYSALTGLGSAVGPFLGGLLLQYLSWRWVMWVSLPFLLAGVLMSLYAIRGPSAKIKYAKLDFPVIGMVLAALVLMVNGIIQVSHAGLIHWSSGGLIVLSVFVGAAVVYRERHYDHPVLDLSIFKIPLVLLTVFAILSGAVAGFVLYFYDPLFLDVIYGMSPFALGLMMLGMPLGQVGISFISGPLAEKFGINTLMVFAIFATLLATIGHMFYGMETPYWFAFAALVLTGITIGLGNVGAASSVLMVLPEEKACTAIGTLGTIWHLVGSIILAISTVIFYRSSHSNMFALVKSQFGNLSVTQTSVVAKVVHMPTKDNLLANAFSGYQLRALTVDLKESFLVGLHSVAWVYLITMFILIFSGLFVWRLTNKNTY